MVTDKKRKNKHSIQREEQNYRDRRLVSLTFSSDLSHLCMSTFNIYSVKQLVFSRSAKGNSSNKQADLWRSLWERIQTQMKISATLFGQKTPIISLKKVNFLLSNPSWKWRRQNYNKLWGNDAFVASNDSRWVIILTIKTEKKAQSTKTLSRFWSSIFAEGGSAVLH